MYKCFVIIIIIVIIIVIIIIIIIIIINGCCRYHQHYHTILSFYTFCVCSNMVLRKTMVRLNVQ